MSPFTIGIIEFRAHKLISEGVRVGDSGENARDFRLHSTHRHLPHLGDGDDFDLGDHDGMCDDIRSLFQ